MRLHAKTITGTTCCLLRRRRGAPRPQPSPQGGGSGRSGTAVWRAALALVGTPFRFHGHDPATGLDCVGLVVAAHRAAGVVPVVVPSAYRVRDMDVDAVGTMLAAAGLVRVDDAAVGDVLLCAVGHGQVHLVIAGVGAFVHAHAGLRRVVLMPGVADGCVGRWRCEPDTTESRLP